MTSTNYGLEVVNYRSGTVPNEYTAWRHEDALRRLPGTRKLPSNSDVCLVNPRKIVAPVKPAKNEV